jgi:Predicted dehydrogenases and related proteins
MAIDRSPDHWHTPAAILGVTHGKHVYVEKPCGHNPYEGELLIAGNEKISKAIDPNG